MDSELLDHDDEADDFGEALSLPPLLAAIAAALVGAAVWAGIAWKWEYEFAYVAWAIGGLIGLAAVKFYGHGLVLGVTCGVLALASIFGGKLAAAYILTEAEIHAIVEQVSPAMFAELQSDAAAFAALPEPHSEEELIEFIATHGYSVDSDPLNVTEGEIEAFREFTIPQLGDITVGRLDHEQWRQNLIEEYRGFLQEEGSIVTFVIDDLTGFDLLFAFLGVSTAFGLVPRRK